MNQHHPLYTPAMAQELAEDLARRMAARRIREAVAEERERCARIAENLALLGNAISSESKADGWRRACKKIADSIRANGAPV